MFELKILKRVWNLYQVSKRKSNVSTCFLLDIKVCVKIFNDFDQNTM